MSFLARIPGREYFVSLFIIGAALFLTFSIVIYRHYDNSTQLNTQVVKGYEVARQSRLLLNNLVNMETGVRGYLLTGERSFLEPYTASKDTIFKQIMSIRTLTEGDMAFNEQLKQWGRESELFRQLLEKQVSLTGHYTQAQLTVSLKEQQDQMDALRSSIEASIGGRLEVLGAQIERSHQKHRSFLIILVSGTTLAIAAMLLITTVILGLIARSKKANAQIELAEERFRTVMTGINDGVYDYNVTDNSIFFSAALREMLGYSEDELQNSVASLKQYMHPDDVDLTFETFALYRKRETQKYANVYRVLHKDGSWRWILSRGVGYWDENGMMTRLIGTHSDITEHKKREDELAQLNAELETYTYIASHDLRSPLVNLRGFTRELELSLDSIKPAIKKVEPHLEASERTLVQQSLDQDIPEALDFIVKAVERMDSLTTAVLDLTRIGKREYVRMRVDVRELLQKCLDVLAYEISKNNIEVSIAELPPVYSDPLALEQIFSNLLDNAVKYMQPGRPGKIHIDVIRTTTDITYTVQDNGRGIEEADIKKVFEIFRRARNTDTVRGMGMGMAFVKATVRKLGGAIWCSSVLGEGTTFYVRVPREMLKE